MANFSKLYITNQGMTLLNERNLTDKNIRFTKMAISSKSYEISEAEDLEILEDIKQEECIRNVSAKENYIQLDTVFNNENLAEGYFINTLGVYAKMEEDEEILFAIAVEESTTSYMPILEQTLTSVQIKLKLLMENTKSINISVDNSAMATVGDILEVQSLIEESAENVTLAAKEYADSTYVQSTGYTDLKISELVNGAPETLNTLNELADAIASNEDVAVALNQAIGKKAAQAELDTHTGNATIHVTQNDKDKLAGIAAGAEVNQNAFSNIVVGSVTIAADSKTDSLTLAGSNITLTPDSANDKLTIGITKNNVVNALGYTPTEITGAATTIASGNLTAGRVLISNTNGKVTASAVTSAELGYLDGVTGNIQAQLNDKSEISHVHLYAGSSSEGGSAKTAIGDKNGNDITVTYAKIGKVLWKTSDTAQEFTGQTITLSEDISNFDYYEIEYALSSTSGTGTSTRFKTGRLPVSARTRLNVAVNYNYVRNIEPPSGTGLKIGDGLKYPTYGNATTEVINTMLIPVRVIGYYSL